MNHVDNPVFGNDWAEAVDVPVQAGDLIMADARLLHGAWGNESAERRTCIISWHNVFNFPQQPSWWTEPIPQAIIDYNPNVQYRDTRVVNLPWMPRRPDYPRDPFRNFVIWIKYVDPDSLRSWWWCADDTEEFVRHLNVGVIF